MSTLFISYASDDQAIALEVCAELEAQGVRCWIAPRDVAAGKVWDEAILDAIEGASAFLLILSSSANGSHFVKNEVNRAFSLGKPIVTFRVEDVTPGRSLELYLARHHWTDGFPPPLEPKVTQLAAAVSGLLGVGVLAGASGTAVATGAPAAPPRVKKRTGAAPASLRRALTMPRSPSRSDWNPRLRRARPAALNRHQTDERAVRCNVVIARRGGRGVILKTHHDGRNGARDKRRAGRDAHRGELCARPRDVEQLPASRLSPDCAAIMRAVSQLFISYASDDQAVALEVCAEQIVVTLNWPAELDRTPR